MDRADAVLGLWVKGPDRLERHVDSNRRREGRFAQRGGTWKGWVYRGKRWGGIVPPSPVVGILIGLRAVYPSGWRTYMGEDGTLWEPEGETRAMALVSTDLRRKPMRVWLDDLEVAR